MGQIAAGEAAEWPTSTLTSTRRAAGRPAEAITSCGELGQGEESRPWPCESAGRQSGHRVGHAAELADRRELAALAHGPAEQLLRVGVDRVQVAAIAGDRFVADALLALPGR